MNLCIDFGGTKTLICILDNQMKIINKVRFETPEHYPDFINTLGSELAKLPEKFTTGVMSVPGLIDHQTGDVIALGNRPWTNFALKRDLLERTGVAMTLLNDARLGGLAEATYLSGDYSRVLYVTVSTGIGAALAVNGKLVEALNDTEAGKMPIMYEGSYTPWEDFASGRAIVARYNQQASEITDPDIWREIASRLALGIGPMIATFQPEAIVFAGGAGQQAEKFREFLKQEIDTILHPVIRKPKAYLISHYKDENVIYGCYFYAKEHSI